MNRPEGPGIHMMVSCIGNDPRAFDLVGGMESLMMKAKEDGISGAAMIAVVASALGYSIGNAYHNKEPKQTLEMAIDTATTILQDCALEVYYNGNGVD